MAKPNNNKFARAARIRLVELGWSVKKLAQKLDRPRTSVSTSIHTERFPNVRKLVKKALSLEEAA